MHVRGLYIVPAISKLPQPRLLSCYYHVRRPTRYIEISRPDLLASAYVCIFARLTSGLLIYEQIR